MVICNSIVPFKSGEVVSKVIESKAASVVVTGGEPLIYNLDYLCKRINERNIKLFLETSGAWPLSGKWDWLCLSPKRNKEPLDENYNKADELKVIIFNESDFEWAEECALKVNDKCLLLLQPEWSNRDVMMLKIVDYILRNPKWRMSLQSHKYMGIP